MAGSTLGGARSRPNSAFAAADFLRHDPFLADFVIGAEAARQQGVAAVVDGQIRERGAATKDLIILARASHDLPGS